MRGPAARVYLKIVRSTLGGKGLGRWAHTSDPGGRSMSRNRVKTYVLDFDDVVNRGIREGYGVLVSGALGAMKSSLTYSTMYKNELQESWNSADFTLDQGNDF